MKEFTRSSEQEFHIYRGNSIDILNSNVKLSSLWGSSRVRLLEKIQVSNISLGPLSEVVNGQVMAGYWQGVLKDLLSVYLELASPDPIEKDRVDNLQNNCQNVMTRIRDLIGFGKFTPYMHIMEAHVADMIKYGLQLFGFVF